MAGAAFDPQAFDQGAFSPQAFSSAPESTSLLQGAFSSGFTGAAQLALLVRAQPAATHAAGCAGPRKSTRRRLAPRRPVPHTTRRNADEELLLAFL